jgi:hypothetical protein
VWIELAREKHRGGLEDFVGSAQLVVLTPERFDLLALVAAEQFFAHALIRFDAADMKAERFCGDSEITRDGGDWAS